MCCAVIQRLTLAFTPSAVGSTGNLCPPPQHSSPLNCCSAAGLSWALSAPASETVTLKTLQRPTPTPPPPPTHTHTHPYATITNAKKIATISAHERIYRAKTAAFCVILLLQCACVFLHTCMQKYIHAHTLISKPKTDVDGNTITCFSDKKARPSSAKTRQRQANSEKKIISPTHQQTENKHSGKVKHQFVT